MQHLQWFPGHMTAAMRMMEDNLKASGRSISWLESQLHSVGIGQKSEVFYAGCNQQGTFFACRGG